MTARGVCVVVLVAIATLSGSGITAIQKGSPGGVVHALVLDGSQVGLVDAVSGGTMVADAVVQTVGGNVNKHPSPARVDPLVLEVDPADMNAAFFKWVASALAGKPESR